MAIAEHAYAKLDYAAPRNLAVTPTPVKKILVIGSCLASAIGPCIERLQPGIEADYILCNNPGQMPLEPPRNIGDYDFQIVQILSRNIFNEGMYFRLDYSNLSAYEELYERSIVWLRAFLKDALKWNVEHGVLTFVVNFLVPQQNQMGRLLPRYDLRNPVHFFERLNHELYKELQNYDNVHFVDLEQIAASLGRRYSRNDSMWATSHGAFLGDFDYEHDQSRIEKPLPLNEYFPAYGMNASIVIESLWFEIEAAFRSLRQIDPVKLVVIDLDDTLWRGIAGEGEDAIGTVEGWPLGFIEALLYLKKRGVLLAIISKNNEESVRRVWARGTAGLLEFDDFVSIKVNWEMKPFNMEAILKETNLLPKNVVYVDDNPVERAAMKKAFPEIRVLGDGHPYFLRRILLWAPETQVPFLTDESSRRTEMIQSQIKREQSRAELSREDFLRSLETSMIFFEITGAAHPRFGRAYELLNKTNQFNSTGRRWSQEEMTSALARNARLIAFEVDDKYTKYGLVGLIIVLDGVIEQFVMSCRVMGMDIEAAALVYAANSLRKDGLLEIRAKFEQTKANFICKDALARNGFSPSDGFWFLTEPRIEFPWNIRIAVDAEPLVG